MEHHFEPTHIAILAGMFLFAFSSMYVLYRVMKRSPLFAEGSNQETATNSDESTNDISETRHY